MRLVAPDAETDLERLTDSFHLNLTAFGLLSFFVGLFIVNSAIGLAFEQRLPMLRTLRACGVSAVELNTVLVFELVFLALIAGLLGMACGYLIAAALLPDVAASLRGLYGAQIPGQLSLQPQWWIAGLFISVIGALLAAAQSLWKASGLSVLAAAQPQAWHQAQRRWVALQGGAALAIFATAFGFFWFGDSLLAGFAVLAAMLLGAALALPLILELVLAHGQRHARGALVGWFWADSRQQLSGLSLALMALLLALSVNVGVSTMVESFSRTFVNWLDGRLAADVFLNAADDAQAKAITAWLRERRDVSAILPGGRAETQLAGAPLEIFGLPDHATYREHWPLLGSTENAWTRLRPGNAAFVSEQLALRLKLAIGDHLDVPTPNGSWPLDVVGIYADYGNPKGQIAVNFAALTRYFPNIPLTRIGLRAEPAAVPALMAALREKFGLDDHSLIDQATLKAESKRIFNRTFAVTARAECLYARRRWYRAAHKPADARKLPPAATRAVVGDWDHAAKVSGDRASQDDVGRADHGIICAAAGSDGGVVSHCRRQREGVRLAPAVSCLPAAIGRASSGRDGGVAGGSKHSRAQARALAACGLDQGLRQ